MLLPLMQLHIAQLQLPMVLRRQCYCCRSKTRAMQKAQMHGLVSPMRLQRQPA
jgi:hypothetical protein